MRLRIPQNLPAIDILAKENIKIDLIKDGIDAHAPELNILLLNLMPKKEETETDFIRVLSNCKFEKEVNLNIDFLRVESHISKNTSKEHLNRFYKTFSQIVLNNYDGMIVTGAPVELFAFEDVTYWKELQKIFEWAKIHVNSSMYICWSAQAALYHFYGIEKRVLSEKVFGIFTHKKIASDDMLFEGFNDTFTIPHSRHTESIDSQICEKGDISILAESEIAGKSILKTNGGREFYISGHLEYPKETLQNEYLRDKAKGLSIKKPINYYKDEESEEEIDFSWSSYAPLLFKNWLTYYCSKINYLKEWK